MARKITKRQQQIYDFIKEYQQEKGYPPSVREMASAVGLSSPSTVHAHLSALEARGLLKRDATKPRALELFNEDGSSVSISKSDEPTAPRGTVSLPLVGRVAAGIPILAEQNIEDGYVAVSEHLTGMVGREGVAVTVMRPSGKVRIDEDDYDAISYYNTYLDPGTPVKVVKVENMQLYVVSVNVDEK